MLRLACHANHTPTPGALAYDRVTDLQRDGLRNYDPIGSLRILQGHLKKEDARELIFPMLSRGQEQKCQSGGNISVKDEHLS
jgi:hypothetical protein